MWGWGAWKEGKCGGGMWRSDRKRGTVRWPDGGGEKDRDGERVKERASAWSTRTHMLPPTPYSLPRPRANTSRTQSAPGSAYRYAMAAAGDPSAVPPLPFNDSSYRRPHNLPPLHPHTHSMEPPPPSPTHAKTALSAHSTPNAQHAHGSHTHTPAQPYDKCPVERVALQALREQVLLLGGRDPVDDGWHVRYVRRPLRRGSGAKTRRSVEYVNRFGHVFVRRSAALAYMGFASARKASGAGRKTRGVVKGAGAGAGGRLLGERGAMGADRVAAALMHTSGLNADGLAGSLMDMGLGHRDPDAHLHSHTYPQLPTMNVSRVLEHAQMGGHSLPAHAAPHSLHYTPLLEPRLELEGFSEGFPVLQVCAHVHMQVSLSLSLSLSLCVCVCVCGFLGGYVHACIHVMSEWARERAR